MDLSDEFQQNCFGINLAAMRLNLRAPRQSSTLPGQAKIELLIVRTELFLGGLQLSEMTHVFLVELAQRLNGDQL